MNQSKQNKQFTRMKSYSRQYVGPIMYEYTAWVLREAQREGFQSLYFLARDAYLLYRIALKICEKENIPIKCKYFYCSRTALRMPSYHLIGDEMYDLLLVYSLYATPCSVLERGGFNEEERKKVYAEICITDENRKLDSEAFEDFTAKLRKSAVYREIVLEKSKKSYRMAIGYFQQEGLFEEETVALVDSGWTGSMQRTIRQLLESKGYRGKVYGFYFGMYCLQKEERDGVYRCFYFDAKTGAGRKALFNNNLFECMLSTDYGMTIGYEEREGKIVPIQKEGLSEEMTQLVRCQTEGALSYAEERLQKDKHYSLTKSFRSVERLLKHCVVYPTREEAELFGRFLFCDDITEAYRMPLADQAQIAQLKAYLIFPKIVRKLLHRKAANIPNLFWNYGTAAFLPIYKRWWYRMNLCFFEYRKYKNAENALKEI